eukprot:superscaffoldBa00011233_g25118
MQHQPAADGDLVLSPIKGFIKRHHVLVAWVIVPLIVQSYSVVFSTEPTDLGRTSLLSQWEMCLVYLDDIIVLGWDINKMLERLSQVFARLCGSWPKASQPTNRKAPNGGVEGTGKNRYGPVTVMVGLVLSSGEGTQRGCMCGADGPEQRAQQPPPAGQETGDKSSGTVSSANWAATLRSKNFPSFPESVRSGRAIDLFCHRRKALIHDLEGELQEVRLNSISPTIVELTLLLDTGD